MGSLTGLYLALEETPGDKLTLMALADYFLEEDQPDVAACLRWTLSRARHPFRYHLGALSIESPKLVEGSWWWTAEDRRIAAEWGLPSTCQLPRAFWKQLPHDFDYSPYVFKQYATIRLAYEALYAAWPLTTAQDRDTRSRRRSR